MPIITNSPPLLGIISQSHHESRKVTVMTHQFTKPPFRCQVRYGAIPTRKTRPISVISAFAFGGEIIIPETGGGEKEEEVFGCRENAKEKKKKKKNPKILDVLIINFRFLL